MNEYEALLAAHVPLATRRSKSLDWLTKVREALAKETATSKGSICIYSTGSLGRLDAGERSDLDLFIIAEDGDKSLKHLQEIELFAALIDVNRRLEFPPFSNDGRFLKIYSLKQLLKATGSPEDDAENLFTARMLLLLESRSVFGDQNYERFLAGIVQHYFRDSAGKKTFRPIFLLNDLLRFWRTLCLNYELLRNDPDRPWRKKNINLKFSRMLTVFATVLPIVAGEALTLERVLDLCHKTPLERLTVALRALNDPHLLKRFQQFLDDYESFLSWKEDEHLEKTFLEPAHKQTRGQAAERFAKFLYSVATHERLNEEFRRYLVI